MEDAPREIGLTGATALVVGTVLGPGILLLRASPPAWVWAVSALLVLPGGLALAELASLFREAGGPYVFLRECYGSLFAFVFGWTFFFVVAGGMVAWLAMSFAGQLAFGVGATRAVGVLFIGILTWVNQRSFRAGRTAQILLAGLQVAGLGAAILYGSPAQPTYTPLACVPAFSGFAVVSFVSAEARRHMSRAWLIGLGVCTLLYALAAGRTPGLQAAVIMILALGAANGWILAAPWISIAQARDHLFFRRFSTPSVANLMLGVWAATLAITGIYQGLMAYGMLAAWFFYGMTVLGLVVRRRAYWALLFVVPAFGYTILMAIAIPQAALTGTVMIASGVPAYYIWRRFLR